MDSPYAREMREARANGKGPDGQKAPALSELDMLIGDVLHFNDRVSVFHGLRLPFPYAHVLRSVGRSC